MSDSPRRLMWALTVLTAAPLALASTLAAQEGTVTGRVTDIATGQAVPSAQVFIEGIDLGALTQANGSYTIADVPTGTQTVIAQRLGYREQNATVQVVAGQTVVQDFEITEAALQLDAVIVTGTPGGTQRRALGNVVSRVDVADISIAPAVSMEQVLQSRVPGVTLHVGSGMVGADAGPIRIRGSSSIGLANDPIVYVDGRRMNADRSFQQGTVGTGSFSRLNDINPADIESIEIIKGPAAATLYGTEASNGVIQIITKRGVSGATRFDVSAELGMNWIPNPEDEFNTPRIWGRDRDGNLISMHLYTLEEQRGIFGGPLFQNGPIQRYSISATGGTDQIQYFASVNRSDLEGFVPWNTDERTSARLNLTTTIGETLTLDLQSSYLKGDTRHPGWLWAEFRRSRVSTAGDLNGSNPTIRRGYGIAPFEVWRDNYEQTNDVERSSWGITLNWDPATWLATRATFGNDVSEEFNNVLFRFMGPIGPISAWREGRKDVDMLKITNRTLDLSASATTQLTEQIGSVSSVGLQYYQKDVWTLTAEGDGFAVGALETVGATADRQANENRFENSTVGAYFQQQFDWNQRIFLTGAIRADDNSAFGEDFDLVYYPKVSGAWVLSEESFWQWDLINQLRVRSAWGQAGQQPDVFAATRLFEARAGTGDASYLTPQQFGNPDLGPEKGSEFEFGVDAAAFDDRVGLEFTWYTKTTKDAIVNRPVAPSQGFPGFQFVNIGQVSNWGTEVALDVQVLTGERLGADMGVSLGTTYSRIDDMGGIEEIAIRRTRRHVQGYPLAAQFERRVVSAEWVEGPGGAVRDVMCDGGTGADGRRQGGAAVPCAEAPRVYWGRQSEPTWTLQLFPTLTLFQDLRLGALFYAQGGNMYGSDALFNAEIAWRNTYKANTLEDLLYVAQRAVAPPALGYYDGGFAKLREVTVSYNIPQSLIQPLGMSAASLTVAGRNLAILWQEQEYGYLAEGPVGDPEKNSIPTEEFTGEPTSGTMPPASHLTVTARVSF